MTDLSKTCSKNFTIRNKRGLHLRPISLFVKMAMQYPCTVTVKKMQGEECDGKSVTDMLTLVSAQGTELNITTIGENAEEALNALGQLIDCGFGEEL